MGECDVFTKLHLNRSPQAFLAAGPPGSCSTPQMAPNLGATVEGFECFYPLVIPSLHVLVRRGTVLCLKFETTQPLTFLHRHADDPAYLAFSLFPLLGGQQELPWAEHSACSIDTFPWSACVRAQRPWDFAPSFLSLLT